MMKKSIIGSFFFLGSLIFFGCQNKTEQAYIEKIKQERAEKDREYSDSLRSPLNPIHLAQFTGLDYFEIDPDYKVEGILELTPNELPFEMPTSTTRLPVYRKYGHFEFELQGKQFVLSVYQNMDFIDDSIYHDYLFIPFRDLSSSKESYGGGRYIDIRIPETQKVVVDFNTAYNPYCAYHDRWSCVIPPPENYLKMEIRAGEKKFHLATH